jgi:hypothetical protein
VGVLGFGGIRDWCMRKIYEKISSYISKLSGFEE